MEKINDSIRDIEKNITETMLEIRAATLELNKCSEADKPRWWEEKRLLRETEVLLRKEKEQLREKLLFILESQRPTGIIPYNSYQISSNFYQHFTSSFILFLFV